MKPFDPKFIATAGRVSRFMMELSAKFQERWQAVKPHVLPYGDLAYGTALMHWYQTGCPKVTWFSYAVGEQPCPYLMEFAAEISQKFGLRILNPEEGMTEERKFETVISKKVVDWGVN